MDVTDEVSENVEITSKFQQRNSRILACFHLYRIHFLKNITI